MPPMNRPTIGIAVGSVLGLLDGLSAWFYPEARSSMIPIVIGSTVKGLLTGLVAGLIARRRQSILLGVMAGVAAGFALSALAAFGQPDHFWAIVLPGMLLGAFVAGLDAGLAFQTWPTYGGAWIPPGLYDLAPWWINHFENHALVHFQHRTLGYVVAVMAVWLYLSLRTIADKPLKLAGVHVIALVAIQIALGVFTLAESLGGVESLVDHPAIMTHASVPPEARVKLGISDSLVRLSIGIEDVRDLAADLESALG